jgi:hypothetical protein
MIYYNAQNHIKLKFFSFDFTWFKFMSFKRNIKHIFYELFRAIRNPDPCSKLNKIAQKVIPSRFSYPENKWNKTFNKVYGIHLK